MLFISPFLSENVTSLWRKKKPILVREKCYRMKKEEIENVTEMERT